MKRIISISVGEVALKKGNRNFFEKKLLSQIKIATKDLGRPNVYRERGKMYVQANEDNLDTLINRVKKVFGIVHVSPGYKVEKDIETIKDAAVKAMEEARKSREIKTFKVDCKRADKKFPMNSMEVARSVGGHILENTEGLNVDVHNPDIYIYVDIRDNAYIFSEKIKGYGGLPLGTNGKGLLLLSGGIDSPVAGFMIAKRGVSIEAVHYHSYPFTSERAEEKVKDLAKILSRYCGKIKLYSVNILNIQKEINKKCPEEEMTIISRRFMMRIAEKIAKENDIDSLITGESLGQVASQTMKGLNVTNSSVNIPVFRPLIGLDKTEITEIAQDIETFETSILPFEDCCTVFLPKHPVTRPKLEDIERSEEALNIELLINEAVEEMDILDIRI
ncbi:tRNA 4-thiouridine(8) synthase ThiI [Clostridium sp. D2Q-11]|uniref:Probable tRNA sulfurtransferase n=1 Tax=Anaeromonas frigoriresistens TaxID=2683708 RepID=A0A942V2X2_9FIRM|nr:tRNA uracil 4-sulfurtransferase ThiI [Anaeromonas frigoriresistens]MBS4540147.1 tRNA 4-thiouridine(8) synthase ThiI [Anaeromonas frigoriresistens]